MKQIKVTPTGQAYYRLRKEYGSMDKSQVKQLEKESANLGKLVADLRYFEHL